jgi:coiled-coil domain-containing protein 130
MPFPIWCATCPKPTVIGQGVRFNAAKTKVGNYHSTPIWSFRFRHAACGGAIEMRTDPQNTAYVVTEGATKRDTGEDKARDGDQVIMTDAEREALRQNAFASLERTIEDREQLKQASARIDGLQDLSQRQWDDPYTQNQKLRKAFRVGRKEREREAAVAEDIQDRLGFGFDLLPASADDATRASLIDFGSAHDDETTGPHNDMALAKPLFGVSASTAIPSGKKKVPVLKAEKRATQSKASLVSAIMGNTRVVQDPFLNKGGKVLDTKLQDHIPGVKRKRDTARETDGEKPPEKVLARAPAATIGLVNYDSD